MTKRIVSGIFILTALGALGVILAGALTSGEQLIVRFLTAVIVAALGLYVISDLRLQADDDAITARSSGSSRVNTVDVPANSTAAFMATVTKRGDKDEDALDRSAAVDPNAESDGDETADGEREPAKVGAEPAASDLTDSIDDQSGRQKVDFGATASSTTEATSAVVEAAGSSNGSEPAGSTRSVSSSAPATVRAIGIAPPKDITLVDVLPAQMNGVEQHDEAGQVDAAGSAASAPTEMSSSQSDLGATSAAAEFASTNDTAAASTGGTGGAAGDGNSGHTQQADADVTAEMKHSTIFEQARINAKVDSLDTDAATEGLLSDKKMAADKEMAGDQEPAADQELAADREAPSESGDDGEQGSQVSTAAVGESTEESTAVSDFEYSDELQSPEHEWPTPPAKPVEPVVEQQHPFEKASAAYQAEKERLAAEAGSASRPVEQQLPVPAAAAEVEAADYADAPLAPIIDLREAGAQTPSTVDAAINAGEIEVVATLIEQGMLSTEGPISDRDVRTMVYVAFTSNELRKLLLAGGSPDGPNYGLDLGPVELFDEKVHAPAPKTLYAGAPRRQRQSQIG